MPTLIHNPSLKSLILSNDRKEALISATYSIEPEDHTALLHVNAVDDSVSDEDIQLFYESVGRWFDSKNQTKLFTNMPERCSKVLAEHPHVQLENARVRSAHSNDLPETDSMVKGVSVCDLKKTGDNEVEQTLRLIKQTYWGEDYTFQHMSNLIANSSIALAITDDKNQKIIGYVAFRGTGEVGYIYDMVIDSDYQSKGYGRALFGELCNTIKNMEKDFTINLVVADPDKGGINGPVSTAKANKIYGSSGFGASKGLFMYLPKLREHLKDREQSLLTPQVKDMSNSAQYSKPSSLLFSTTINEKKKQQTSICPSFSIL